MNVCTANSFKRKTSTSAKFSATGFHSNGIRITIWMKDEAGGMTMVLSSGGVLTEYLNAALRHIRMERLADDGQMYAEIPVCPGVWASAQDEEGVRREIQEVLEEWLILKIRDREPIPEIDGRSLRL